MVRVLVVGPVANLCGSVGKLKTVNTKKGPFQLMFLLGAPQSTLAAESMPAPTYFVATAFDEDSTPRSVGEELHYKGGCVNESIGGLRVVMCATDSDANSLCNRVASGEMDSSSVDVMITHCGPKTVGKGSEAVSLLGKSLKPRYHFFGGGDFKAFDAFQAEGADYATRVISVGASGRWIYAANVAPLQDMSQADRVSTVPGKMGEDMYRNVLEKRVRVEKEVGGRPRKQVRNDCWFCLSNDVEKHLVVAVGKAAYVALAKGGINETHLVIVPVAHVERGTSEQVKEEIVADVERFSEGIRKYYASEKGCQAMVFEWCGEADMMHMCVQAVGIRKEVCGRVGQVCVDTAKRFGLEVRLEEGSNGLREARRRGATECFWAEIPNGQRLVAEFAGEKKVGANFGRIVAAQALGRLERVEWRKCVLGKADAAALAQKVGCELARYLA